MKIYGVPPGTMLNLRLRNKDPARTMSDRVAMAHDIRYSLSTNIGSVRDADNKMIRKLKEIRRLGQDSKWNTTIGLRGIQGKKLLENIGVLKRNLFLAPGKDINEAALKKKLRELELKGFGKPRAILPGEVLKRRIILKLGRKMKGVGRKPIRLKGKRGGRSIRMKGRGKHSKIVKPIEASKLIVKRLIPKILEQIKKLGVRQIKKLTTRLKDDLIDRIAAKIKLKRGGILGVLGLPLVTAAIKFLPIGKDIAEIITPIIFKLFGITIPTRNPRLPGGGKHGKGIALSMGLAIAKLLFDLIQKKLAGEGLHGSGIVSSILKAGKIIAKLIKRGIPIAKKIIKTGVPIVKGVFKTIKFLSDIKRKGKKRRARKKRLEFRRGLQQEIPL